MILSILRVILAKNRGEVSVSSVVTLNRPQLLIQTEEQVEYVDLQPGSSWTLGRYPDNDIHLSDRCASRQHAKLVSIQDQHYCYVDLNSSNGSRINKQRIKEPLWLQHGDRIQIGDTYLCFQDTVAHRSTGSRLDTNAQVLLLQGNTLQGKIWQTLLRSQDIDSFWESAEIDIKACLPQRDATQTLPKLLILDTQLQGDQTYDLCAWCRQTYPQMQIIVNNSQERQILINEREKATQVGCLHWFPAFREPKLLDNVAGIVVQMNGVVQALENISLRQDKLFVALKSFEQAIAEVTSLTPSPSSPPSVTPNLPSASEASPSITELDDFTQVRRKP
ncbi:MAG: FHA domain-containing protein [Acaryochloris sp. RU_4_1]|nr:FHA domain-containing protein [Acaryochloris sp. RU_4_1]NJR55819.1 FHA domain-containing protein [Acaryochloris sp. CRU_2_0]